MEEHEIHVEPGSLEVRLHPKVELFLRSSNPWWDGRPMAPLPAYRRWLFDVVLSRLERARTPVTALRGPRQVGKTTLQQQVIRHLLDEEEVDPRRIFHVQFDELPRFRSDDLPIFLLCSWFEQQVLGATFNEWAHRGEPALLVFDEAQNLEDWAPQLKSLVDHHTVHVLLTGSSALRIEAGRDSLAGRIWTLELGPLLLREIADLRGFGEIEPAMGVNGVMALTERSFWEALRDRGERRSEVRDRAFAAFAERGGYPMAQTAPDDPWEDVADLLNETVIRRVLRHDVELAQGVSADPRLLEQVFRTACRYAGHDAGHKVFLTAIRESLNLDVEWAEVVTYLQALDDSLLVRRVPPRDLRLRRQAERHKLCLCDHSLRASWLGEKIALGPEALARDPASSRLAGPLAESIVGYFLSTVPGLDVAWLPARPDEAEIDLVVTVGDQLLPIEIKYRQRIDPRRDVAALRAFMDNELNRAPLALLVTLHDGVEVDDPRIVALPLASLLLLR